jgi:hypothetical protein
MVSAVVIRHNGAVMKNLTCASSITIAALLVGCGGPVAQTGTLSSMGLQQQVPQVRQPTEGGEFTASYKGTLRRSGVCYKFKGEILDFHGHGDASFLHLSHEFGKVLVEGPRGACSLVEGYFDLRSAENGFDTIHVKVSFSQGIGTYHVLFGTGKFANATGSGSWSFKRTGDSYDDTWNGTLNF